MSLEMHGSSGGEFDFGFSLEDNSLDNKLAAPLEKRLKAAVVRKSKCSSDTVLRMRKKIFRPREGRIDNNAAVNSIQCRTFLRNNTGEFKLYAFPTFDKCDSLLFLPTSIAALCNSGDFKTLAKVLHARSAKDCKLNINVLSAGDLAIGYFVKMQEHIAESHPDVIIYAHNTRVKGNEIHATLHVKLTASKIMYNSVMQTKKDAIFKSLFSVERGAFLAQVIDGEDISEEKKMEYRAFINTDLDLVVHKRSEMVLTIDDTTKKFTHMSMKCRLTDQGCSCIVQ